MRYGNDSLARHLIIRFVLIFVVLVVSSILSRKTTYRNVINTEKELGIMIYSCTSRYKNEIKFQCSFDVATVDYNQLFRDIMDKDTYLGCELYACGYYYSIDRATGLYNVTLKIQKPSRYRIFMTKLRVKQIAYFLRGLDRYDQIKAVHDYLVKVNEYDSVYDTAYNALYVNRSACNGYAYSFYAIMEELGIPATVEYGGAHAWNSVELDGKWYNVDCTWDDPRGGGSGCSYDYFLKCDDDFPQHTHGNSTAETSFDMVKAGPSNYYQKIPPLNLITTTIEVVVLVLIMVAFYVYLKKHDRRF